MAGASLTLSGRRALGQPAPLHVTGSRPTIFYAPLIAVVTQGFLKAEGVESDFHWLGAGNALDGMRNGSVDVIQSAVSSAWSLAERGESDIPVHIAEINRRDGFFLVARPAAPNFDWRQLEGKSIVAELGGQPAHMLRFAIAYNKADPEKIRRIDGGTGADLIAAFKNGNADFGHFQGAAAQQLELEGEGKIVVSIGASMPEVAFSSISCLRGFAEKPAYRPFLRAFARAKTWAHTTAPGEVARLLAPQFSGENVAALTDAVVAYQKLGCWSGPLGISRAHYDQTWNVFLAAGAVKRTYAFETFCIPPPV
jgi:NitT/TauT family transport system substrate-binding protein